MRKIQTFFCLLIFTMIFFGCNEKPINKIDKIKVSHPLSDSEINTVVIEEVAQQLGVSKKKIIPNEVFSNQPNNGDLLDVVEVTIAIEERLGIMIIDKEIDRAANSKNSTETPHKLKISTFQEVVRKTYHQKYNKK